MKSFNTYLEFDGNCREAMTFYGKCLDAKVDLIPFGEAPMPTPPDAKDRIMHARLVNGSSTIMASDTMAGMPFQPGHNFSISIDCDSDTEAEQFFNALAENGKVTMPLQKTFWAARFGMLMDQFGIKWMVNYDEKTSAS